MPDQHVSRCPFCFRLAGGSAIKENDLAAVLMDAFPLNPGHLLIVPKRHEADYFDLSRAETDAMHDLLVLMVAVYRERPQHTGYNVGLNIGAGGGQTVPHAHMHLIPRLAGDVPDPRGGIRWTLPERAAYWEDKWAE